MLCRSVTKRGSASETFQSLPSETLSRSKRSECLSACDFELSQLFRHSFSSSSNSPVVTCRQVATQELAAALNDISRHVSQAQQHLMDDSVVSEANAVDSNGLASIDSPARVGPRARRNALSKNNATVITGSDRGGAPADAEPLPRCTPFQSE